MNSPCHPWSVIYNRRGNRNMSKRKRPSPQPQPKPAPTPPPVAEPVAPVTVSSSPARRRAPVWLFAVAGVALIAVIAAIVIAAAAADEAERGDTGGAGGEARKGAPAGDASIPVVVPFHVVPLDV